MKISFLLIAFLTSFPFLSFAQYNESQYSQISRGEDPQNLDDPFVIVYKNNANPSYRLRKVYADSAYTELLSKTFFKDSLPEGPYISYYKDSVAMQGTFKNGQWDGEWLTYREGQLLLKAYYTEGVKTGTWEEYTPQGGLKRRITFNDAGEIVSDTKY